MVKRRYKGGSKAPPHGHSDIPKPQVSTYPAGSGTARDSAIARQNADSEHLNHLNNHTHGDGSQQGGSQCSGGPVPVAPTYGVKQGPGHMGSDAQSTANYNGACQAHANAALDSQVQPPQGGGKRKRKTRKHKKSKRRHTRTMKKHHKKSHKKRNRANKRHKKSHKMRHKK